MSGIVATRLRRRYGLAAFLCLAACTPALHSALTRDGCAVFDDIATQEMLLTACTASGPRSFAALKPEGQRLYVLSYGPAKENPDSGCTVRVASGGALLDRRHFAEHYEAERKAKADRGASYFDFYFPKIGRRALVEPGGFGPGGGGYSIIFTTSDGCCDVKVEQGGLLSDDDNALVDLHKLARSLSDAYDHALQKANLSPSR